MPNRIRVGTANWTDHTGFYPRGTRPQDRLAYYAERLPMVEVNASFYRRIKPRDYAQWAKHTPDHFGFVVKAHRAVCQRPRDASLIDEYLQSQRRAVKPLRDAGKFLGFLVQFGPNVRPNDDNLAYLGRIREGFQDDRVAVEFRHPSWLEGVARSRTLEQLRMHRLALVMPDEPRAALIGLPPPVDQLTDPAMAYYRFAGRDTGASGISSRDRRALRARHTYTPGEIPELAKRVAAGHGLGVESIVVFYNKQGPNRVNAAIDLLAELRT